MSLGLQRALRSQPLLGPVSSLKKPLPTLLFELSVDVVIEGLETRTLQCRESGSLSIAAGRHSLESVRLS